MGCTLQNQSLVVKLVGPTARRFLMDYCCYCALHLLIPFSWLASSPVFVTLIVPLFVLCNFLLLSCLSTWVFPSLLISLFLWMEYWFCRTTADKMSPQVLLEFIQVHNFLQLNGLMWELWGPRHVLIPGFSLCQVSLHGVLFFVFSPTSNTVTSDLYFFTTIIS